MQSAQASRSPAAVQQYLADYVVAIFPSVFSNKPFLSRLYGEVKRHHRYLRLFTAPEGDAGDKERIITGAQLLTVQTMLMFLLSALYDLQGPADDGSCPLHTTYQQCLSRKSPFDASQSYCQWSPGSDVPCAYQEPQFSLQVLIYIAVLVALMCAAISYPIDRIFELLSAPLEDDMKAAAQEGSALQRMGRRMSNAARRASNVAMSAVSTAKAKLAATRTTIVGAVTRKIPGPTETAHALASATIASIAEVSRRDQQARQLARMRTYRQFAQSSAVQSGHNRSCSFDSACSSSDARDESGEVQQPAVRDAEAPLPLQSPALYIDTRMDSLTAELRCQRMLLTPEERLEFDAQWGMDPTASLCWESRRRSSA
jgi:hypothetical protein